MTYKHLVDRNEIAFLLGVGPTAVSNYVARTSDKHPPFPKALVVRANGRFRLWDLEDVARWHEKAFPERTKAFHNANARLRAYRGDQS